MKPAMTKDDMLFLEEAAKFMTLKPITVESLEVMAQPFIDAGAKTLFFAAVENRVYCGLKVPNAVEGQENSSPHSVLFTVGSDSLEQVVELLEKNR